MTDTQGASTTGADGGRVPSTQPASSQVELTVSKSGSGSGTVTSSPAGISCGATCSAMFAQGSQVTLTATPTPGDSLFTGWSGGGCSGTGTCTVTLNAATTVSATFNPPPEITLTVVLDPAGDGYVYADDGLVCGTADGDPGPTCTEHYEGGAGSTVALTEVPTRGTFTGWEGGGCSGTSRDCVVTLNGDTTITAHFAYSPPPTKCIVPNVKGKKLAAAKRAIKSHHCSVGRITRVAAKHKGRVISQKPKAGKRLPKGSKVALKVGK